MARVLVPRPSAMAMFDDPEDALDLWNRATAVLDELDGIDDRLREAVREHQRSHLRILRLESVAHGDTGSMRGEMFETDRKQTAREELVDARERHSVLANRLDELRDERQRLRQTIERNFMAVDTAHLDLSPVDELRVRDQVGRPAEMGV